MTIGGTGASSMYIPRRESPAPQGSNLSPANSQGRQPTVSDLPSYKSLSPATDKDGMAQFKNDGLGKSTYGKNTYDKNATDENGKPKECHTCENRRYQDVSDDAGVSFQTPTRVSPGAAAAAVRSHEQEHVSREQTKAELDDREVVSQSVRIHTGICGECGKTYVAGGTTTTTTRARQSDLNNKFSVGLDVPKGSSLDITA